MTFVREIKARKAKFGFDCGSLRLSNVVEMGKFVEAVQTEFADTRYIIEESGYSPSTVVKIYTEEEEVANFIRCYKP